MTSVLAVALAAEKNVQSKNPILPAVNEIVWSSIAFAVLVVLLYKFAWPGIKAGMQARTDRIRNSLDEAEGARTEAQTILADYQRQLADARNESSRIIEEARQAADKLRQDLRRQAEAEVAEIRQRASEDIAAQSERAVADLRRQVREFSIELAEKVVGASLDRERNLALVDRFIDQVGTQN
ncbi:MAG: F0F1 ATP synthase subunit B [Acidimicrobiales bacterium]